MKSELRLLGKNAVVTGGSSGIGLAIAQAFVEEGAKVAITGRDADVLNEAVKAIGSDSISVPADVKSVSQIALMFKTVSEQLSGLDILVANAGIAVARSLDDES